MKKSSLFLPCLLCGLLVMAMGCSDYHNLNINRLEFSPQVSGVNWAKGERIILGYVYNRAENTTVWGYYSSLGVELDKKKIFYETGNLTYYFRYALERTFNQAGMLVFKKEDSPPKGIPYMETTLTSMTDAEFQFQIHLSAEGKPDYYHDFAVKADPLPPSPPSPEELRKWSLDTMNKAALAVLQDKGFQSALLSMQ